MAAIVAALAAMADVAVAIDALAVATRPSVAAGIAAGATMVIIAIEVDACPVTAGLASTAGMATGATVFLAGLQILEADPGTAAARTVAERRVSLPAKTDARATVAARATVIGVGAQVIDASSVAA